MNIHITFTYLSTTYHGFLSPVHGAGQKTWHLYVDKYYWGMLRLVKDKWVFDSNHKEGISELADYFGQVVMAWEG
jgi:hypothetical protein